MQSDFFWHELMTTDVKAAQAFYSTVFDWIPKGVSNETMVGNDYFTWGLAGQSMDVAGLMALPEMALKSGARPAWAGYLYVTDVDLKIAELVAAGGKVMVGPMTIPGIGRMAMVTDPQGAHFYMMHPTPPEGVEVKPIPFNTVGSFSWNELYAADGKQAFDFYSRLFGWSKEMAVDMGPMGTYQCFGANGTMIGGVMTKMAEMPIPWWNYYVMVDAIGETRAKIEANGGTLISGPHEVPGPMYVATFTDPQGAVFSITGARL